MTILENTKEAFRAIRANFVRTILTILIIAFGLTALIGVLTAIDGVSFWFADSFLRLGTNTIRIENYTSELRTEGGRAKSTRHPSITYLEAKTFKEQFSSYAPVSMTATGNMAAKARYQGKTTQDRLQLIGVDENYLLTSNFELDEGRFINATDVLNGTKAIVLGKEAQDQLFAAGNPIGKSVQINGKSYEVVGTFKRQGAVGAMGGDKLNVIPVTTTARDFPRKDRSFGLQVYAENVELLDIVSAEATGQMRRVRGLKPKESDNFGVVKVETYVASFMENLRFLTWSATAIALITLFSASIGLMNIMLVSVTERTREIGIRKAMGGTRRNILLQFLTEAVMITQIGGFVGITFGILIGNLVGLLLGNNFTVPWNWVIIGFAICFVVGIISGIAPARKAAALDPIESLRYE